MARMARSGRSFRTRASGAEQSIRNAGLCLTDFAALEALLHKGPLTITQIQEKVLLASGSMTAAIDWLEKRGLVVRKSYVKRSACPNRGTHSGRKTSSRPVLRKAC